MLNRIILQGRLVADPELRHTQNGVAVATFRLAVDRDFKDRDTGERKADFINVVAWRHTGEFASRYFGKGQMAVLEGKLQSRTYEDQDGKRRYTTEVIAENLYFCGSKREGDSTGSSGKKFDHEDYAAAGRAYNAAETAGQFTDMDEDDGELPF